MSLLPLAASACRVRRLTTEAVKSADRPTVSYRLAGRLYASRSGWILLSVPNALVNGAFDALDEPGVELPPGPEGRLNAHISVIRPEELETIGGPDKISERGHMFHYTLGAMKTVQPAGWEGISKVWLLEVQSPGLKRLRVSYGLTPLPKNNEFQFHITVAVRRTSVLRQSGPRKAAGFVCRRCRRQDCECLGNVVWVDPEEPDDGKQSQDRFFLGEAARSRLSQPLTWDSQASLPENLGRYWSDISGRARQRVNEEYTDRRLQDMNDYQAQWQRLMNNLRGQNSLITHPLDKLLLS